MITPNTFLHPNLFDKDVERLPTRNGYGLGLVEAGKNDERVVVLCADLAESTRSEYFQKEFPLRFVEVGVAEQNMASLASGMALAGKIPFISSYAAFSPGRNNEQIRTTIALNNVGVKIAGAHAGLSVGPDGATHQALEDIALMRALPNMAVLVPCDLEEAKKATVAAAKHNGPVYIRLAREATPVMTTDRTPFAIGRAQVFHEGSDVTIIAAGPLVHEALLAAQALLKRGVSAEVLNCASVKPLAEHDIIESVKKTGAVVTVEEHQIAGGLGGAVAELLCRELPLPVEFVGVRDRFGESGTPEELLTAFRLTHPFIIEAARKAIQRKR
ncbi:MAG: transketolase family protein [Candidatus Wildermuthbacteria bacterium]|nr:transketolase family protein [Candidatus Wildermuthbacteria bacterium]